MKRYIKLIMAAALVMIAAVGCKKDEKRVFYEGGKAPTLTSTITGSRTLSATNRNNTFLSLRWTNPEYMFTTGVSSQNVTYIIQIDTVGANFTNPDRQEVSISGDMQRNFTVGEFNGLMTRMKLTADIPHNMEVRVISSINGSARLISNAVQITGVTNFEDFAIAPPTTNELYITGDATPSSWTNAPPAAQKLTRVNRGEYFIIMDFVPGRFYKFLSHQGQWQPQYGGNSATGGDLGVNMGSSSDPDAIPTPTTAGRYKVEVNFRTGKYTVTRQ